MSNHNFFKKKERRKKFRTFIQILIILVGILLLIIILFKPTSYEYDINTPTTDKGFLAISYFGVERTGSDTLIDVEILEKHIKALKDSGFTTISQKDVMEYYLNKKPLPYKSVMLMFEDGRRDTTIFAQKLLEKYNYKASMLTYADKFEQKDSKFLSGDDLRNLDENTFWELGTNGYRLSYINVFDRYKNYVGELNSQEFVELSKYFGRNYDHYLMDFIRDENGIPKESYLQMKDRITYDYDAMKKYFEDEIGYLPELYILMHSNSGRFGSNEKVSQINDREIKSNFSMNFNREGYSYNTLVDNIYDLTRVQPQAYWNVNHLLMKIWSDSDQNVKFVVGDKKLASNWNLLNGAAEFDDEDIIITSEPSSIGRLKLEKNIKNIKSLNEFKISTRFLGNSYGAQSIYLNADELLKNFVQIKLSRNIVSVIESIDGKKEELYSINLDEFDEIEYNSVQEDENESLKDISSLKQELAVVLIDNPGTVADGIEAYIPEIQLKKQQNRLFSIILKKDTLSINIDDKILIDDLNINFKTFGDVILEASSSEEIYSQRNLNDNIYDAVFKEFYISDTTEENIYIEHRIRGINKIMHTLIDLWDASVDWFINNL